MASVVGQLVAVQPDTGNGLWRHHRKSISDFRQIHCRWRWSGRRIAHCRRLRSRQLPQVEFHRRRQIQPRQCRSLIVANSRRTHIYQLNFFAPFYTKIPPMEAGKTTALQFNAILQSGILKFAEKVFTHLRFGDIVNRSKLPEV